MQRVKDFDARELAEKQAEIHHEEERKKRMAASVAATHPVVRSRSSPLKKSQKKALKSGIHATSPPLPPLER